MVLIIDNYDSFTYNLVQRIGELKGGGGHSIEVRRNDAISTAGVDELAPTHLIVSPGPCTPNEAGVSMEIILHLAGKIPVLGVCLGHQCIAQAFGGKVVRARRLMHGKTSEIKHDSKGVFSGLSNPFTATRYHSLIVDDDAIPTDFHATAWSADRKELMGIRHDSMPIIGVQFHPESFLTTEGHHLLSNFLEM
ncbi:MAG: aminodeoxychorismate/anthranilate synthase component II [Planctomycetes bacterium]|nr:aminodeoxychorismate/anthranilate synthase component II [Planctomycetota bacterium]